MAILARVGRFGGQHAKIGLALLRLLAHGRTCPYKLYESDLDAFPPPQKTLLSWRRLYTVKFRHKITLYILYLHLQHIRTGRVELSITGTCRAFRKICFSFRPEFFLIFLIISKTCRLISKRTRRR